MENERSCCWGLQSSLLLLGILWWKWHERIRSHWAWHKLKDFASGLAEGFKTLSKIDNKGLFVVHKLIIWSMYFFMVYICIFALPATSTLSYSNMLFVGGGWRHGHGGSCAWRGWSLPLFSGPQPRCSRRVRNGRFEFCHTRSQCASPYGNHLWRGGVFVFDQKKVGRTKHIGPDPVQWVCSMACKMF